MEALSVADSIRNELIIGGLTPELITKMETHNTFVFVPVQELVKASLNVVKRLMIADKDFATRYYSGTYLAVLANVINANIEIALYVFMTLGLGSFEDLVKPSLACSPQHNITRCVNEFQSHELVFISCELFSEMATHAKYRPFFDRVIDYVIVPGKIGVRLSA